METPDNLGRAPHWSTLKDKQSLGTRRSPGSGSRADEMKPPVPVATSRGTTPMSGLIGTVIIPPRQRPRTPQPVALSTFIVIGLW